MYSRVTLLEIDTTRIAIEDAVELYAAEVVPRLEDQEGYEGSVVLTTPEGKALLITVWATEEAAAATAEFAAGQLADYTMLFASPPGRDHYEVSYFEMPGVRA